MVIARTAYRLAPRVALAAALLLLGLWSAPAWSQPLAPVLDVRVSPEAPVAGEPFRILIESQTQGIRHVAPLADGQVLILGQMTSVRRQMGPQGATSLSRFEFTVRQNTPGPIGIEGFRVETTQGPATVPWAGPDVVSRNGSGQRPPPATAQQAQPPATAQQAPRAAGGQASQASDRPPRPGSSTMHMGPLASEAGGEPLLAVSSSHTQAWLGEPMVVDILLLLPVGQGGWNMVDFDAPIFDGFWFRRLERQRQQRLGGRLGIESIRNELHEVYLLASYELAALHPGSHVLPSGILTIERRGRVRGQEPIELEAPPFRIEVLEPPSDTLPRDVHVLGTGVERVDLTHERTHLRDGEALVATLTLSGLGLASRWAPPRPPNPGDWRIERPEVSAEQRESGEGWLEGRSTITWRAEPTRTGALHFGPLRLASWDPREERWRTWDLDPISANVESVAPAADASEGQPSSQRVIETLAPAIERARRSAAPTPTPLGTPWFWTLALLPFVFLISAEGWRLRARTRKAAAGQPAHRRQRLLDELLAHDNAAANLPWSTGVRIAEEALTLDLDRPVRGRSRDGLLREAAKLGATAQTRVTALLTLLEDAERHRFGSGDAQYLPAAWCQRLREALQCDT